MLTIIEKIAMSSKLINDAHSRKGIRKTLKNRLVVIDEIERLTELHPEMSYSELEDLVKFFTPWIGIN